MQDAGELAGRSNQAEPREGLVAHMRNQLRGSLTNVRKAWSGLSSYGRFPTVSFPTVEDRWQVEGAGAAGG